MYINPENHQEFFIEGSGRFFIINDTDGQIMLSGDFYLPTEKHNMDELFEGIVLISVKLYTTRVPEQVTYINEANLKYGVQIDNSMIKKKQIFIARDTQHNVYLMDSEYDQDIETAIHLGKMRFLDTNKKSKVIDLRGMRFLRNDY